MTGDIVIAVIVLVTFIAGGLIGAFLLISLASRREDCETLSQRAPDGIARAGRFVTGLRIENQAGCNARVRYKQDSQLELSGQVHQGGGPEAL